ncbi:RNA-splicing ligase RtcB [Candidatus Pacearchaeota archaeon ex4484_26]|nr:MAG: RNA-splicing ligase RtcB [Candidatus Pacearchaeota archaeon ex4484_26]
MPIPSFVKKKSDYEWLISKDYKKGMRVPAKIIASEKLVSNMDNQVYDQITNVATLPGILKNAYCMPDGHSGYGFPIGGVAAFDLKEGVISPGGIGFDVNCGIRLVTTNLTFKDVKPKLKELVNELFKQVPTGVGCKGFVKISRNEFRDVIEQGSEWCLKNGYAWKEDLEHTEENGHMKGADANKVSQRAIQRGFNQIGTLGSGNHYLEIQHVKKENIYDNALAEKLGLFPEQIVVMFHCGSRGFGHQVATDYLQLFLKVMQNKYGIKILDRELSCAPFLSKEGQDYFSAMQCAVNMAFANRQVILHRIREVFSKVFGKSAEKLEMNQVYDVAHNIAKREKYIINNKYKEVLVHRKGATRAFGPGRMEIPQALRKIGQPVLIGGSMETGSYLLLGTKKAEEETFASTAHGSGRIMSRAQARRTYRGDKLQKELEQKGIYIRTASFAGLAEEAGGAYKELEEVVDSTVKAGISKKVAKFIPIGNIKG